ncbi:MAG: Legume lectin domain, partial [Planctomycetota bacterium]
MPHGQPLLVRSACDNISSMCAGPVGGVDFSNGNAVHVRLTYDAVSNQLYESLTDLSNNNTYGHTYSNINFASLLGTSQAYIGFTGASGGKTAIQTVRDFSFQSNQADGIALVFQEQGTGAVGNSSGGLGYVGIAGANAA